MGKVQSYKQTQMNTRGSRKVPAWNPESKAEQEHDL